jgi:hypothetical protein
MDLWEMRCGNLNDFASLIHVDAADVWQEIFDADGSEKNWPKRPAVQPFVDKRRKKQKPLADISFLTHGTILLNERAYSVLVDFLQPFGQLLEVDCSAGLRYYYNVTRLRNIIDFERSEKLGTAITRAVFKPQAFPVGAEIFKDPLTATTRIYLSDAAKIILEQRIGQANLSGLLIFKAGENWC